METSIYEEEVFAAELNSNTVASLDLHGLNRYEAELELLEFLSREHVREERKQRKIVKVITGGGKAILQKKMLEILESKKLNFIDYYRFQIHPFPSKNAIYIVLAPNNQ